MRVRIEGRDDVEATYEAGIELHFSRNEGVWLLDQITMLLEQDGAMEFKLRISPRQPLRERRPLFPASPKAEGER